MFFSFRVEIAVVNRERMVLPCMQVAPTGNKINVNIQSPINPDPPLKTIQKQRQAVQIKKLNKCLIPSRFEHETLFE